MVCHITSSVIKCKWHHKRWCSRDMHYSIHLFKAIADFHVNNSCGTINYSGLSFIKHSSNTAVAVCLSMLTVLYHGLSHHMAKHMCCKKKA